MRRALTIDEAFYGNDQPGGVTTRLNNLAQLLQATNRLDEAEPLMRRALAMSEAIYDISSPNIAGYLQNLAMLLQDTNRLDKAEPLMRRAIIIYVEYMKKIGSEHPDLEIALTNYTDLLLTMGRSDAEMRTIFKVLLAPIPNFYRATLAPE